MGPERLTLAEIVERFPDHWIALDQVDQEQGKISAGRIVLASADQVEAEQALSRSTSDRKQLLCTKDQRALTLLFWKLGLLNSENSCLTPSAQPTT